MTETVTEELQREVSEERTRVDETIEAIQRKLTPGQIVDELLHLTRAAGGELAGEIGKTISRNPLPAAMIAVGLVWLLASQVSTSGDKPAEPAKGTEPGPG